MSYLLGEIVTIRCPRTPTLDGKVAQVIRVSPGFDVTPNTVTVRTHVGSKLFNFAPHELERKSPQE